MIPSSENQIQSVLNQDAGILETVFLIASQVRAHAPVIDSKNPPSVHIVGGFLRDALLGKKPKDADIEVCGVAPEVLTQIIDDCFPAKSSVVGKAYAVIKLQLHDNTSIDISVPRRISDVDASRFEQGDARITPEEAAQLRDFTINAPAFEPISKTIKNFCSGIDHLFSGILTIAGTESSFSRDPLRVLRGCQFAARCHLTPDAEMNRIARSISEKGLLKSIHLRRITDEFSKLLLKSERPSEGFELYRSWGVIDSIFTVFLEISREPNAWSHLLETVDAIGGLFIENKTEVSNSVKLQAFLAGMLIAFGAEDVESQIDVARKLFSHFEYPAQWYGASVLTPLALTRFQAEMKEIKRLESSESNSQPKPQTKTPIKSKVGLGRIAPQGQKKAPALELQRKRFEMFCDSIYPVSQEVLTHLLPLYIQDLDLNLVSLFQALSKKFDIQKRIALTLVDKEILTKEAGISRGAHLGFIIGEVERLRFELLTKERALAWVKENASALHEKAEKALSSTAPLRYR